MSSAWIFQVFISLIVIVNPFSLLPVFIRLTGDAYRVDEKRKIVYKSCLTGGIILFMCAMFGGQLFRILNVPTCALRIFGGLLLLLSSIDMIVVKQSRFSNPTAAEEREALRKTDISVFPMSVPLIAGPGSCASILVLTESCNSNQFLVLLSMIGLVLFLVYITLSYADDIQRVIGITFTNAFVRVCGIILGGLATTSILTGIEDFITLKLS